MIEHAPPKLLLQVRVLVGTPVIIDTNFAGKRFLTIGTIIIGTDVL
ncbi:MAG: hypothetical protein ACI971_000710, partial [Colwellia sp.]